MKYVFFDTETTGLKRSDEVIEFASIVTDENLYPLFYEQFWCYTQVPISKGACDTHGIDAGLLWELSGGKTFEDNFFDLRVHNDKDLVWVSYSNGKFDERLINQSLKNNGLKPYSFGAALPYFKRSFSGVHSLDIYKLLKSRCFSGREMRLCNALAWSYGDWGAEFAVNLFKKVTYLDNSTVKFHGALFDAFCLFLIARKNAKELGLGEL